MSAPNGGQSKNVRTSGMAIWFLEGNMFDKRTAPYATVFLGLTASEKAARAEVTREQTGKGIEY
jgi:hypothetical protein